MSVRFLSGVNIDSNTLFVDDANNRVGIGTASPLSLLHVYGSNPRNLIQDAGAGYPYVQLNNSSGNFYISIDNSSGSGFGSAYGRYLYSEGAYPMIFTTDSAERLRITGAGNVGIGTTSTFGRLQISGTVGNPDLSSATATGVSLVISNNDTGYGTMFATYGNGNGALQQRRTNTNTYYDFLLQPHGGNVGIGTTSPATKLDVSGDTFVRGVIFGYAGGGNQFGGLTWDSTDSGILFLKSSNVIQVNINSSGNSYLNGGNVGIGTTTPAQKLHVVGNTTITGVTYTDVVQTYSGASIDFRHQDASVVMRVDTANARVGIGTTSPSYKLDVSGDIRSTTINLGTQGVNVSSYGFLSQTLSGQMTFLGHNVRASSTVNNTALVVNGGWISSLIKQYYNEGITFHTSTTEYAASATYPLADTERMRITSAGNVGIGTSAPAQKLQVVGNIGVGDGTYNGGVYANSSTSAVDTNWGFDFLYTTGQSDYSTRLKYYPVTGENRKGGIWNSLSNSWVLYGDSNNTPNVIIPSGNVGIGTTSPSEKLHIYGASNQIIKIENSGTYLMYLGLVSNEGYIGSTNATPLTFYTNNVNRMYINTSGNVGIGTTSPAANLHVIGTESRFGGVASGYISVYNANSRSGYLQANEGSDFRIASDTNDMTFYVNGSERVRFTAGGNVGIGTTSPSGKLSVDGGSFRFNWANPATANYVWINRASGQDGGILLTKDQTLDWQINNSGGASNLDFYAYGASATAMSLTRATANVLIGTTTDAGYKLDVNGTGRFSGSITSNASGVGTLLLGSTSGSSQIAGRITATESPSYNATGKIGFSVTTWGVGTDYGLTEVMAIDMRTADSKAPTIWMNPFGGNVGIGTTSPSTPLEIAHSNGNAFIVRTNDSTAANNAGFILANVASATQSSRRSVFVMDANGANGSGADYTYFDVYGNGVTSIVNAKSDGILAFGTADTERMRITSAGNVGIGTTSPVVKTHIVGPTLTTTSETTYPLWLSDTGDTTKALILGFDLANDVGVIQAVDQAVAWKSVSLTPIGGSVLIGTTTNAGYKIDVSGTGRFTDTVNLTKGANNSVGAGSAIYFQGGSGSSYNILQQGVGTFIIFGFDGASWGEKLIITNTTGALNLPGYGSGSRTGTPAYNLGVDSSGNVIELPGGVVDGSGTANKVTKWSDANTITDANITDNGSTVRINSLPLMADSRLAVGTAGADQTYASVFIGGNLTEGSSQYALLLDPQLDGTTNYGMLSNARIAANVTATTAYGIYQINNELLSGATVENNFGIYIANQTSGTTQNWNLYSVTGKNYFGGNVLIGTTTDAGYKLDVSGAVRGDFFRAQNSTTTGTTTLSYSDQFKQVWTTLTSFSFTGAGVYYFNLVFQTDYGFTYDLTATTSRDGLWRNFGTLRDNSYLNVESDGDFETYAVGDVQIISNGMYLDAAPTAFKSATTTASGVNGTSPWAYYIVRYAVYIPTYAGNTTGFFKVHLTTYGYDGNAPLFINA